MLITNNNNNKKSHRRRSTRQVVGVVGRRRLLDQAGRVLVRRAASEDLPDDLGEPRARGLELRGLLDLGDSQELVALPAQVVDKGTQQRGPCAQLQGKKNKLRMKYVLSVYIYLSNISAVDTNRSITIKPFSIIVFLLELTTFRKEKERKHAQRNLHLIDTLKTYVEGVFRRGSQTHTRTYT